MILVVAYCLPFHHVCAWSLILIGSILSNNKELLGCTVEPFYFFVPLFFLAAPDNRSVCMAATWSWFLLVQSAPYRKKGTGAALELNKPDFFREKNKPDLDMRFTPGKFSNKHCHWGALLTFVGLISQLL